MERLGFDEKMLILMNLPPNEVIVVCESSMNKVCHQEKYKSLWQQKIKKDFDVEYTGPNPYQKYRFLHQLYETYMYIVTTVVDGFCDVSIKMFSTREQAEKYVFSKIGTYTYTYSAMKIALKTGTLRLENKVYRLKKLKVGSKIYPSGLIKAFDRERHEYQNVKEELARLGQEVIQRQEEMNREIQVERKREDDAELEEDEVEEIEGEIEEETDRQTEFLNDVRYSIKFFNDQFGRRDLYGNVLVDARTVINRIVDTIDDEYNLGDRRQEFRNLLIKRLWVPEGILHKLNE